MTGNEITLILRKFLMRRGVEAKEMHFIVNGELLDLYNDVAKDLVLQSNLLNNTLKKIFTGINIQLEGIVTSVESFLYGVVGGRDTKWALADDNIIVLPERVTNISIEVYYSRLPSPMLDMDDEIDLPGKVVNYFIELVKAKAVYEFASGDLEAYENLLIKYVSDINRTVAIRGLGKVRRYWLGLPGDGNYFEIVDNEATPDNVVRDGSTGEWVFVD
jgi:hypothetical protein